MGGGRVMAVSDTRDYQDWHRAYDDAGSGLSWRLRRVRHHIRDALEEHPGQARVLSVCAGDGRDLLGVLTERADTRRVSAVLLELDPGLAQRARDAAAAAGLTRLEVRTVDAGATDSYLGAVPADLVLLVGIFGNVTDDDVWRLVAFAPRLCRPGATLVGSRGRGLGREIPGVTSGDTNSEVRTKLETAGFTELAYETHEVGGLPALGVVRYVGPAVALTRSRRPVFTFVR